MTTRQTQGKVNPKDSAGMTSRDALKHAGENIHFHSRRYTIKARAGFTLVELMVVVGIIGVILAIVTMNFKQWNDKYTVEAYTKELHSILMKSRNDAANTNTQVRVTLAANLVTTHQDTDGDGVVDAGEPTTTKPYPLFAIQFAISPIVFDRRGMTNSIQTINIAGYSPNASPGVDCIAIAPTRINMGVMTGGPPSVCVQQ